MSFVHGVSGRGACANEHWLNVGVVLEVRGVEGGDKYSAEVLALGVLGERAGKAVASRESLRFLVGKAIEPANIAETKGR